jgi:hypothetical protein
MINANIQNAEQRIQGTVCPIYAVDDQRRPNLVGSSMLLRVATRSFLLTAAHVLDENKSSTLYVGGGDELVELTGRAHRTTPPTTGRKDDLLDFAFIDVSDRSQDQWSRYRFLTTDDLDVDDHPSAHTLYAFVGYPETRNKRRAGRAFRLSTMASVLMPTRLKRYSSLGLNPLVHFAGDFSRNKQLDSRKRVVVSPDPHGLSGGGVWRLGTSEEFAVGVNHERLVGLAIEYRRARSVLIGVRISMIAATLAVAYPELIEYLPLPSLIRARPLIQQGEPS